MYRTSLLVIYALNTARGRGVKSDAKLLPLKCLATAMKRVCIFRRPVLLYTKVVFVDSDTFHKIWSLIKYETAKNVKFDKIWSSKKFEVWLNMKQQNRMGLEPLTQCSGAIIHNHYTTKGCSDRNRNLIPNQFNWINL